MYLHRQNPTRFPNSLSIFLQAVPVSILPTFGSVLLHEQYEINFVWKSGLGKDKQKYGSYYVINLLHRFIKRLILANGVFSGFFVLHYSTTI